MPLLGRYPKKYKFMYKRETCIPMFIASLFTAAMNKLSNQLRCPTYKWKKKYDGGEDKGEWWRG
jgi:hypothetical protein